MASDHLGIDTQQLLPNVLERRAKVNPEGTFAKVPKSATTYELGFRTVTNLELHDAVNQVCWLLEKCWGKGQGFPTVAYMGPTDLRYSMVVLAGIKTGYKVSTTHCTHCCGELNQSLVIDISALTPQ